MHDQFVEEMVKAVGALKQGDPFTEGVNLGPLINEPAAKKVREEHADWRVGLGDQRIGRGMGTRVRESMGTEG